MTTLIDPRNQPATLDELRDGQAVVPGSHVHTPVAGQAISDMAADAPPTLADWSRQHGACEWASMRWAGEQPEQLAVVEEAIIRRHAAALRRVAPLLAAEARARVAVASPDEIIDALAICESVAARVIIIAALNQRSDGALAR